MFGREIPHIFLLLPILKPCVARCLTLTHAHFYATFGRTICPVNDDVEQFLRKTCVNAHWVNVFMMLSS